MMKTIWRLIYTYEVWLIYILPNKLPTASGSYSMFPKKDIRDCFGRFFDGNRAASRRAYMVFKMKGYPLADQDHVFPYCCAILYKENGQVTGLAFHLRRKDGYLSVN